MNSPNSAMEFAIMIATIVAAVAACLAAWWAKNIGKRQNEINQRSLDIQNFVELFVMPQQVIMKNEQGQEVPLRWNLLIKNASSYPIYLSNFSLSGLRHIIGSSAVPNNPDNWYAIPIPNNIQQNGNLSLDVEFEDYLGQKYISRHSGSFDGMSWQIISQKRELIY